MTGRYERVNTQDDDPDTPSSLQPRRIPNSPPPSFRSRSSSTERTRHNVNSDLADAFDTDADDSDDEPDDRQRLVRGNSFPVSQSSMAAASSAQSASGEPEVLQSRSTQSQAQSNGAVNPSAQPTTNSRIYGGGIQSDGVFSNMTARPERGEKIVEELPPVRTLLTASRRNMC